MIIDLVNIFLDFWFKPLLFLALMLSISIYSFRFSAASVHWLLACSFFITFLGIVLAQCLPRVSVAVLPSSVAAMTATPVSSEASISPFIFFLTAVYILGFTWICFFQLLSLQETKKLGKFSIPINNFGVNNKLKNKANLLGIKKTVRLASSEMLESPIMFGYRSPLIILPKDYQTWSDGCLERVLIHELSHVQRNDWLIKIACKFVCAFVWPVPLVWYVINRIEWFAELACDDSVINLLGCREDYAEDLLSFSKKPSQYHVAMSLTSSSNTFLRIQYLLDGSQHRIAASQLFKWANLLLCIFLIIPLSFLSAAPVASTGIENNILGGQTYYHDVSTFLRNERDKSIGEQQKIGEIDLTTPKYLINILPDSPNFTEEVITTVTGNVMEEPNGEWHSTAASSIAQIKTAVTDIKPALSPYTEVKGMLPRVMSTPLYPASALRKNIEGRVIVQFDINETGNVINPRIVYSSPAKVFNKSVLTALKKSKFTPMEVEGRLIIIKNITQSYLFKLTESTTDKTVIERPQHTRIARYTR